MEVAILIWVVCGISAAVVGSLRGANGCLWFGLGFLLGPLGLALSFAAGSGRTCPACCKHIHADATKCPYCQTETEKPGNSGERQTATGLICSKCTFINNGGQKFCGQCASPLLTSPRIVI